MLVSDWVLLLLPGLTAQFLRLGPFIIPSGVEVFLGLRVESAGLPAGPHSTCAPLLSVCSQLTLCLPSAGHCLGSGVTVLGRA